MTDGQQVDPHHQTGAHTLDLFSQDARALLSHLGFDQAVIWGQSAGAPIAMTFALRYPAVTTGLILTDGSPWFSRDPAVVDRLKDRLRVLQDQGPEAAYNERRSAGTVGLDVFSPVAAPASGGQSASLENLRSNIKSALAAVPRDERILKYAAELRTYSAFVDFDATEWFRDLVMPILVIYGAQDRVFRDVEWDTLTASMPNVRYEAFGNSGHGVTSEPRAGAIIEEFLGSISST